eukprot:gene15672-33115_t
MSHIFISKSLPRSLILALSQCDDVVVFRKCGDIPTISLVNSYTGLKRYNEYLLDGNDVDPVLEPHFGDPIGPYVCPLAQREVYNLLTTFAPLVAADFEKNPINFPFIPAVFPINGGIRYHHAKMSMYAVHMEIERLERFAANCPSLAALPSDDDIDSGGSTHGAIYLL